MSDDDSSSQASASDAESESPPPQWNVNSRQRRTTAGNRLSTLLQQEEAKDDDVELLFVEDEEEPDEEFDVPASAPGSDVEPDDEGGSSDSSSSSEDEEGADDELAGEKQLEKEERQAKRRNKRKADAALIKPRSTKPKRVKIVEPSTSDSPGPRKRSTAQQPLPKKKSERVSWILAEDKAQRTSSRTLSMQNKVRTQASLKEAETRRIRQMATNEAAQKRKDASKAKPMNQADRMAEAARTERANAKSLNRWEEMERERIMKQKAKLDALQNRTLEGPVIRWWSGRADWVDGKCVRVGKVNMIEDITDASTKSKKGKRASSESKPLPKDDPKQLSTVTPIDLANSNVAEHNPLHVEQKQAVQESERMDVNKTQTPHVTPLQPLPQSDVSTDASAQQQQQPSFLDGIEAYAAHPEDSAHPLAAPPTTPPNVSQTQQDVKTDASSAESFTTPPEPASQPTTTERPVTNITTTDSTPPKHSHIPHPLDLIHAPQQVPQPLPQATPNTAPNIPTTHSAFQTLTLINYPSHTLAPTPTALDLRRRIIFALPSGPSSLKPQKPPQTLCAATGQPAKYWDPRLGVGYRDMEAGRRLRRLVGGLGIDLDQGNEGGMMMGNRANGMVREGEQRAVWSAVLGAWVSGRQGVAGVPAGFDGGTVDVDANEGPKGDDLGQKGEEDVKPAAGVVAS